ncbi:MAG: multiheme c-type cytochrome, partial [Armatimonadota bacterium]
YGMGVLNADAARRLPFVCANRDVQPQWAQEHRIFRFALPGRKRPLVVGVSGVSGWARGADGVQELSEQELIQCAQRAVQKLRGRCDFVVLMVHADLPVCIKVADAVPSTDLLIAGHVGSTTTQQPIRHGRTIVVANGNRGRFATRPELWFTQELKLREFRASLPECLKCHTVGSGTPGGYLNRRHTGHLGGMQCESCHGAGRWHAETAGQKKPSAHLISASVPEKVCLRCHTSDRCPHFEYQKAVRLVAHKAVGGTKRP